MAVLRSSVIDMAAAEMSHLPVAVSWPDLMPSKGVSTMAWVAPTFLASRSIMSTSKPTILPLSSGYWKGA